jgi:2-(1,2-epoxy-1,2-dihydrophenyl)acetyl-CoA isomerase
MSELIETLEDGVLLLVMNRPEAMNALSSSMMDGLLKGLRRAAEDPEIGCVVVRGAGDKAFCRRRRQGHGGGRPHARRVV